MEIPTPIQQRTDSWSWRRLPPLDLPRNALMIWARVARLRVAFALSMPVVAAVVLAWQQTGIWQSLPLFFSCLGVLSAALGFNLLTEVSDYRRSLAVSEQTSNVEPITGFDLLASGRVSLGHAQSLALFLMVLNSVCVAWLAFLVGWPLLFFGGLSLFLTLSYTLPPLRYAYRSWGVGELGVWLNFALLQPLSAYYAQSQTLSWLLLWVALSLGILATLCVHNYNFVHHRRDWLMRKRTIVVQFGPERAIDFSTIFVVGAYITLLVIVSMGVFPLRALVSLAALPVAVGIFSQIDREVMNSQDGMALARATSNATLLTTFLFCLFLLLK